MASGDTVLSADVAVEMDQIQTGWAAGVAAGPAYRVVLLAVTDPVDGDSNPVPLSTIQANGSAATPAATFALDPTKQYTLTIKEA
jgi:hypothetical protein